jgi:hypothetical protein
MVAAERRESNSFNYVRVWPWKTLLSRIWARTLREILPGRSIALSPKAAEYYRPYPDEQYYLQMLGDPSEFGTVPTNP